MDLYERCRHVTTGQLSDALDRLGLHPLGLTGITALQPGARFAGSARTVLFRPKEEVDPADRVEYLEHVRPGDVIVIANNGRLECSSWGGQRSVGARSLGAVGVVLHGAYRDVDELRAVDLPVFGLGPTVAASRHGGIPVAVDVPVEITGCTVHAGDLVVGDASGVIVVPAGAAEEAVAVAESLAAAEAAVRTEVAAGHDYLAAKAAAKAAS